MKKELTISQVARRGGLASAKKLTKKQRIERATKSANARWNNKK